MKKIELLAPAKDKNCAISAIDFGADAVYIGAGSFGARKNATNSISDIEEVVNYAHKFWAKVYVTINTILTNSELDEAQKLIHKLYEIGVDGIIFQDFGILELAHLNKLPPIRLYASTQCDNRTFEKVKFFENVGVKRVILARELSINQINSISKNTSIELESFVHGALCVSYSGNCYLSAFCGGRSANRGECAQPCRKKYSLVDENGKIIIKNKHLLSLNDFNASNKLEKLIGAGVSSFKIEGRLKDESYIKNVVGYYRRALDKISSRTSSGVIDFDFEPNLNKSFNRGFCDYFLENRKKCFNFITPKSMGEKLGKITKIGKDYFVINAKLNPQDGICFTYKDELTGTLINKVVGEKVYPFKMTGLEKGVELYRNFDSAFEKTLKNSKTKRKIVAEIEFIDGTIKVKDENNNCVKLEISDFEKAQNEEKMRQNFISQMKKGGVFEIQNVYIKSTLPFIPISKLNEIRRELLDLLMTKRLEVYKRKTQKEINYAKFPYTKVDYKMNVHNDLARKFYENCGCEAVESSLESSCNFAGKELMRTKHCLKFAFDMCGSDKKLFLLSEHNKKYPLEFDCKNCEMVILSPL